MTPTKKSAAPAKKTTAPVIPAAIAGVSLTYEKVMLTVDGFTLYIERLDEDRYRLYAKLNYITVAAAEWTYDETFAGTPSQVYAHATHRIKELAELKVTHDAVHDRVRRMSEGEP